MRENTKTHKSLIAIFLVLLCGTVVAQDDETCLTCHEDQFDAKAFAESVHGNQEMSCIYCHQSLVGVEDFPHKKDLKPVNCGGCHRETKKIYDKSLHGYALARGNSRAPTCSDCHGTHGILNHLDPRSPTHKTRLPQTCAHCHGKAGLLTDQIVKLPESFRDYTESVHGQAAQRGIGEAASCADCHEVHDLKSSVDPQSPINPRNQAATCGKCHPDIERAYDGSIHGRAVQAGVTDSPTCTDCHGEHLILSPRNPDAKTHSDKIAKETCGKCHDDPVIVAKYSLRKGVVGSYTDSYHGWATRRQDKQAATCVSCHTPHSILPAVDAASTINPNNVVETCKQCHDRATAKFAQSYSHETASVEANPINKTIKTIYLVMIAVVIGGMVLHNLVIMNFYMVERRRKEDAGKWVLRFDRAQIIQHLVLTLSFVGLVVTGFALRFPDAGWVKFLLRIGLTEELRGDLHRFFGIVLIVVAITHVYYIFVTRRGRREFRAMVPVISDMKDLSGNLKFHTWYSRRKVEFGRYDYSQKAEYWALIWGTMLMIVTGFILWFPEVAVRYFPYWIVSAAQTVHYYEAWLATLAILVWHFFFVIFHPEEYPMSWTWLTGRMSESSVKKHHGRWYREEVEGAEEQSAGD